MIVRPRFESFLNRDGATLEAHVFEPPEPSGSTVAFFHPGGFTMGDPSWGHRFAPAHLELGHTFVSLGYRLAGRGVMMDDLLADAADGIEWAAANLVGGGSRLFTSGHSAGGYLALVPVLRDVEAAVCGIAVLSVVPRMSQSTVGSLLSPDADLALYDPGVQVGSRPVPAIFLHGSADEIVPLRGSEDLDDAWAASRCPSRLVVIDGADHFFNNPTHGRRAEGELAAAIDWLEQFGERQET
ncbi:MAG: alpha/beta hydrolase fold domain-containing protein [Actinomycetia bacterium]|nr:alpha/beta hydrolase fold domain-containing protein [Actinomycetes bacterium]MCP4959872.1 alpha/beta hydrolase fold domain-containing protein [Actinomycetes bacterium]